jgi:putative peptidoglycan lipid II flippase
MNVLRRNLRGVSRASVTRSILGATVTIMALTAVVKIVSAGKEVVVAGFYGPSDALDAFLVALVLPTFAINIVSGSFHVSLIPTIVRVRERAGIAEAKRLLGSVMVCALLALVLVASVLAALGPYLLTFIASGFTGPKFALTLRLFYLILSVVVLVGVASIWAAVLNACRKFAIAAVVPIITPIAIVIAIGLGAVCYTGRFSTGRFSPIYLLAIATLAGAALEAVLLGSNLKRVGFSASIVWGGFTPSLVVIIRQSLPAIAGAVLFGGTGLVDQAFAASLPSGSVSIVAFGSKVVILAVGIAGMAAATAAFPHFSQMATKGDWIGIRHTLRVHTRIITVLSVAVTLIICAQSHYIVALLFQRGQFSASDTEIVGDFQFWLALQIPFCLLTILRVRLVSALQANHILLWSSALSLVTDICSNAVLVPRYGVIGIALSNILFQIGQMLFLYLLVDCRLETMVAKTSIR